MTEPKAKKNMDYSASAVNLTNHESFKGMFVYLRKWQENKTRLESELKEKNTELFDSIARCDKEIANSINDIRLTIDERGSYQDLEKGDYAVKQRVVAVSYSPEKCHEFLSPSLVAAVIVESVDKGTVEALVKAGRITDEQQEAISKKSESYRFIIK